MKGEPMNEVAPRTGLFEKIKDTLNPSNISEKLNLNRNRILEMGLYLIVGFVVGYLLKRYSKFVFYTAFIIIFLLILTQLDLISLGINWAKLQSLFGFQPVEDSSASSVLASYWEWIKMNLAFVLSFTIGFLFGLRLG